METSVKHRGCRSRVIKTTLSVMALVVTVVTITHYNVSTQTSLNLIPPAEALSTNTLPQNGIACPRIRWSKDRYPKTALASFPGSGNTWTRHLLQQMTGIPTGAIYNNDFLRNHGFPGEGVEDRTVVAIKTHANFTPEYDRCILLMRAPFEAFIAEFNRLYTDNQTAHVKLEVFIKNWDDFFESHCTRYRSHYLSWLKHDNILLILYENLKKNLPRQLHRMLAFLQKSTNITGNVQCALKNSTGVVKRDHSKSLPYDFFFSKQKIEKLNRIITEVADAFNSRFPNEALLIRKWKM